MITAEKCRIHATECRILASSIDIPAERSLEQSIMALNWEALADQMITITLKLLRRELLKRGWWPSLLACFDP
jgi:hypothetical protein